MPLINKKGHELRVGDKVYNYSLKAYDEISYIETLSDDEIFVNWKAHKGLFF